MKLKTRERERKKNGEMRKSIVHMMDTQLDAYVGGYWPAKFELRNEKRGFQVLTREV